MAVSPRGTSPGHVPGDVDATAGVARASQVPQEIAQIRVVDLLEALPEPCCLIEVDPDGAQRVLWASASLQALTGYEGAEVAQLAAMLHTVTAPDPTEAEDTLTGRTDPIVRTITRKDGITFRAVVTALPLGQPGATTWLLTVRDATDELLSAAVDQERRSTEERARRGLSLVARVSDILADFTSVTALADIALLLTRRVVPWAAFYGQGVRMEKITDLGGVPQHRRKASRHRTARAQRGDVVATIFHEHRMQTAVLDRDRPAPADSLTAELVDLLATDETVPDDGPLWLLPVLGRKDVLGLMAVQPHTAGQAPELVTVLELVARRVGMAMDNLQLYTHEHQLAETLQRAMLPEQGVVRGLDVWSYYAPNSEHAQVGGDWYDVLDLGESRVGVVVGDVVGHDVEAAAAMGQLRSVARAYAAEFVDPATVLTKVDRLVAGMRIARPASFVYAALQPRLADGGRWELSFSRAGHLPIVHVRDGEATTLGGANGPLIGFGGVERHGAGATLRAGDVLIFYTDGLIERRDRSMRDGLRDLQQAAAQIDAPDAAGIGEELLQRLADAPEDDMALVVVRIPDPDAGTHDWSGPRQRRWQMPTDPATIGRSRQAVLRACEAWGIKDTAAAELVVSELVANAVMHGWGRIDLRLSATDDGLRIEVEDSNPSPPLVREGHSNRIGGFGLHIVSRLAEWGWRPSPAGKVVWARVRGKEPWAPSPPDE